MRHHLVFVYGFVFFFVFFVFFIVSIVFCSVSVFAIEKRVEDFQVELESFEVVLEKKKAYVGEEFFLLIRSRGYLFTEPPADSIDSIEENKKKEQDKKKQEVKMGPWALVYPKELSQSNLGIVNIELNHSVELSDEKVLRGELHQKKNFLFELKYVFQAKEEGRFSIPSLQVGITNARWTHFFLSTPAKEIQILRSSFFGSKEFLVLLTVFGMSLFVVFWMKYTPRLVYLDVLEIRTFRLFLRLKERQERQIRKVRKQEHNLSNLGRLAWFRIPFLSNFFFKKKKKKLAFQIEKLLFGYVKEIEKKEGALTKGFQEKYEELRRQIRVWLIQDEKKEKNRLEKTLIPKASISKILQKAPASPANLNSSSSKEQIKKQNLDDPTIEESLENNENSIEKNIEENYKTLLFLARQERSETSFQKGESKGKKKYKKTKTRFIKLLKLGLRIPNIVKKVPFYKKKS